MVKVKQILFLVILVGLNFVSVKMFAAGSELSSQDLLIQKLTQIQLNLAGSDPARAGVLLRLADLHSERARLLSMKEINDSCTVCKAGEPDRNKAVTYYNEALEKIPHEESSKILLQLGHLYELQGHGDKAEAKYHEILKVSKSQLEKAEAYLSLAESAFRKSNYSLAKDYYQSVLSIEGASSQGLAAYRQAWCYFKLGQADVAIEKLKNILSEPKLQSRLAVSRGAADVQFLEEVSRDMVTFMAARGIKENDAQIVYDLTPENFKLMQIVLLAREGLRLGQKEMDIKVWDFVYQKHSDSKIRLESKARQTQLLFDLKKSQLAQTSFESTLALWAASGCTPETCDEVYKGLKQFVVGWNRLESKKATSELIAAYKEYLKVFPQDVDMTIWAAQASASAEQYKEAAEFNFAANELLFKTNDKDKKDKLEKNLLLTIEMAEKAKDEKLLEQAQNDYISKSLTKQKMLDVKYQKAYAIYQKEKYQIASEQLKSLALTESGDTKIKMQAADLALDSLVLLKDDTKIKEWSKEFANAFPQKKSEYMGIYQKTILTQTAQLATTDSNQAYAVLTQFDFNNANAADKKIYFKNKILLLEKLSKISEARSATEDYLKLANLAPDEVQFGLERKAWFAELELDFTTALKATESIKKPTGTSENHILKMALFAELAQLDPVTYYSSYLKNSQDKEKKALIAINLINQSKNPEADFNRLKIYLNDQPEMLAQAMLDVYSVTKSHKLLESLAQLKTAKPHQAVQFAQRMLFMEELKTLSASIEKHQINSKNSKTLAVSLKERTRLLEKVDAVANKAIASSDWTSQVLSLDLVAKQNNRFYNEVLSLPVPESLVGDQVQEYLGLLTQQVAPNQSKAQMAEQKIKEFWSDKDIAKKFINAHQEISSSNPKWGQFLKAEVGQLAAVAPAESKPGMDNVLIEMDKRGPASATASTQPSLADVEKARLQLKANPFEVAAVQNMLELEKQSRRPAMVKYLETRLDNLLKSKENPTKETH